MTPHSISDEQIFSDALARPLSERAVFLDGACHGDAALHARISALLAAHDGPESVMTSSPVTRPAPLPDLSAVGSAKAEEKPGDRIGHYKLLQQIGEGGCGVVYMAEQEEPVRRRVALKIIKLGMDRLCEGETGIGTLRRCREYGPHGGRRTAGQWLHGESRSEPRSCAELARPRDRTAGSR